MAAAPALAPAPASPVAGRQSVLIPWNLIDPGDRLREIDWDWSAALAIQFRKDGQKQPATVNQVGDRFSLVIGGHRWGAAKINDTTLEAFIVDETSAEARISEIVENVYRRELGPLDKAAFIAELYAIEKARAGWADGQSDKAFSASKRWLKDASANLALASGLAEAVGDKVGLGRRSIFNFLELHRALHPELRSALADRRIDASAAQLSRVGKLDPALQRRIAEGVAAGQSLDYAHNAHSPRPETDAEAKRLSAFIGSFSRMAVRERKAALQALADLGLPKGFALTTPGGADV